jgi:hypothetical protein
MRANQHLMAAPLLFNCWVHGDDFSQVVPIKIANTKSVSTLKEVIKDKNPESFHGVDAHSLVLWKVSIPVNRQFQQSIAILDLTDQTLLSSLDDLANVFSDQPHHKHLHIIVKPRVGE